MRTILGLIVAVVVVVVVQGALSAQTTLPNVLNWAIAVAAGYVVGNLVARIGKRKAEKELEDV